MSDTKINSAIVKLARERANKTWQPVRIFKDDDGTLRFQMPFDLPPHSWELVETVEPAR